MTADVVWLPAARLFSLYQPITARDGQAIGFEALLRGVQDGVPLGAPALFDAARANGTERLLDRRAAEAAVLGAADALGSRLLFVNLSPANILVAAAWLDALLGHLARAGLPAEQVVVELNEAQELGEQAVLSPLLDEARQQGLRVALDDVLGDARTDELCRTLRPEFVKVAGSVVRGLTQPEGLLPLERVLRAADQVGAVVIAEEVETRAQLELLHACGVELTQGHLTGVPERRLTTPEPPRPPGLVLVPRLHAH